MSSSGEVYGTYILPDRFNTDILLPNGLFITMPCKREFTLETIKKQLWITINSSVMKIFNIGDQSSFIFSAITYDGKEEQFYQESRRICDLRLFDLILKLIEPEGNKEEKRLNSMIDIAIGKKVAELILDLPRDIRDEVTEFRKGKHHDLENALLDQIDQGLLFSSYSNYVDVPFKIRIISASYVNVRNVDSMFVRVAVYHGTDCLDVKDSSQVEPSNPKWDQWLKFDFHCTELPRSAKLCLSICVVNKKRPKYTYAIGSVNFSLFNYRGFLRSGRNHLSLWPAPKDSEDLLFPLGVLGDNPNNDSASLLFELLSFDRHVLFAPIRDIYSYAAHALQQEPSPGSDSIQIPKLPSNATNLASTSSTNNSNNPNSYYTHYSSIRVDFRNRTLSNSCADTRAFIERRLSSSSNNNNNTTRRDSVSTTYNDNLTSTARSRRPTANSETKFSGPSSRTSSILSVSSPPTIDKDEESNIQLVNELIATPPFTPLNTQQKALLWNMRFYCKRISESLPKLLDAIDWKSRNQLAQLYVLLDEWGQVSLECALRLLDTKYEDKYVRQHAVKWLDNCINEAMLACYLLQFIQVLKTEPYLENELSTFLVNRALLSPHIGNLFFWYIRSECDEMSDYHNTIRFRYLLERYLKGLSEERLSILTRQVHGIDKLMILAEALKDSNEVGASKEEKLKFMQTQLQRVDFTDVLHNIPDPVNCRRFLGELLFDDCRIMDSAKRPLWLVWSLPIFTDERVKLYPDNPRCKDDVIRRSSYSSTNINGVPVATSAIIFKVGDDLRQDMLTLQIIRIVDSIWRSEGLDMCMLAYTCLATGKNVGIIEVVNRAETITSIQKSGGRMAAIQIDSTHLHRWIKERNHDNYDEAIERFTRSCAGYSVLTFVLGIADRNPDNIMVSEDGRIFHIDFGHFLGHFKKKFGINRERVPFVLTDDFLHVIARGSHARETGSFDTFKDLCHEAYVSLRRHSNLLITLFTMMLRTGIPELRSIDDISYLKTSLQVGQSEEVAREFFHTQFFEAYYGAWATKVDWFFHNITRM